MSSSPLGRQSTFFLFSLFDSHRGRFFYSPTFFYLFCSLGPGQLVTIVYYNFLHMSGQGSLQPTGSSLQLNGGRTGSLQPTARPAAQGGPVRLRSQAGQRVSRFVFTLNNWTDAEYAELTEDFALQTKWMIVAKETGESGTPHLQGAVVLGKQMTWSRIKGINCFKRAHFEPMRGSPHDSLVYCSKDDPSPFIHGALPEPGKRNDLRMVTDRILAGDSIRDLAVDPEAATSVVKFYKGLSVLRSLVLPKKREAPVVIWVYGKTGLHKTRCALKSGRAMARALGRKPDDIWMSSGGLRWFDGYDGQAVAILDDFRAKHVANFAFFLRLLDRYSFDVEFKGGFVSWRPRVIFITCPYSPDECFATRGKHVPEDMQQLHRRITQVVHFEHEFSKENRREFVEDCLSLLPRNPDEDLGGEPVGRPEEEEVEMDEDALDPDFLN